MSADTPSAAPGGPATTADATGQRRDRKARQGVVVSDKMDKTVVVVVERRTTHPLYHKIIKKSEKFHAHDEANDVAVGDRVRIVETRPLSKKKRWRVETILERAK